MQPTILILFIFRLPKFSPHHIPLIYIYILISSQVYFHRFITCHTILQHFITSLVTSLVTSSNHIPKIQATSAAPAGDTRAAAWRIALPAPAPQGAAAAAGWALRAPPRRPHTTPGAHGTMGPWGGWEVGYGNHWCSVLMISLLDDSKVKGRLFLNMFFWNSFGEANGWHWLHFLQRESCSGSLRVQEQACNLPIVTSVWINIFPPSTAPSPQIFSQGRGWHCWESWPSETSAGHVPSPWTRHLGYRPRLRSRRSARGACCVSVDGYIDIPSQGLLLASRISGHQKAWLPAFLSTSNLQLPSAFLATHVPAAKWHDCRQNPSPQAIK